MILTLEKRKFIFLIEFEAYNDLEKKYFLET